MMTRFLDTDDNPDFYQNQNLIITF